MNGKSGRDLTASLSGAQEPIGFKAVKPAYEQEWRGSKLALPVLVTKFCVAARPSFL
jgi:hypothetical protein